MSFLCLNVKLCAYNGIIFKILSLQIETVWCGVDYPTLGNDSMYVPERQRFHFGVGESEVVM